MAMSDWEIRSLDRSLDGAKQRALGKSRRFLQAAGELLVETGGISFTVHDVVKRSKLSLGSFYRAFAGKDDLLLALFEQIVVHGATIQAELIADIEDPLEQLRACVRWLATPRALAGDGDTPGLRALTMLRFSLASTRPSDLATAVLPQMTVIRDSIDRGIAAGQIRDDIPSWRLAETVVTLGWTAGQSSILRTTNFDEATAADDLWSFCREGLLARP
jgi:AcrR family transcriptional regulator